MGVVSPDAVNLVRQSFHMLDAVSHQAAGMFYGRLFTIAPEVKPMFGEADMLQQAEKLWKMLAWIVGALDKPEVLLPAAGKLAVTHVGYGVVPAHYAVVGDALIWTLATGLGPRFDTETKDAWAAAYTALSGAMIAAAEATGATPDAEPITETE